MSDTRPVSLVTGGCGFVGRHLVDALVARGDRVRIIDVRPSAHRSDVEYIRGDITKANEVRAACEGAATVFHNASLVHTRSGRIQDTIAVNVDGTRNVVTGCRAEKVPKLVYVSSGAVVYEGKDIINGDESLPYTTASTPYPASKRDAEEYVLSQNDENLLTVALRPHVVFGPGDERLIPTLLKAAKKGTLRFRIGRVDWMSDFTYVSNLIDGFLQADEALKPGSALAGKAYFLTNGEPMAFWDFVARVLARMGFPPIRMSVPAKLAYAAAAVKETFESLRGSPSGTEDGFSRFGIKYLCTHHYFSIARAQRDFAYRPKVSIAEGIERTCQDLMRSAA